jgi:acetyl esterase/lipase
MRALLVALTLAAAVAAPSAAAGACTPMDMAGAVDPALDMTSLGATPARYEVGRPAGPVRRVMLLVHGGGWFQVGLGAMAMDREAAAAWRAAGWETVNIDYRACGRSVGDVVAMYDRVRRRVGPRMPICVEGESAGGHLALMLAIRRPRVACVIALAAPTDLRTGNASVRRHAREAFGADRLRALSPVTGVRRVRARVLLATAEDDPYIPLTHARVFATRLRAVRPRAFVTVAALGPGPLPFVHGTAARAAVRGLHRRLARLVEPFGAAPI